MTKSVTQNWDILVSYTVGDDLNKLLKSSWAGLLGTTEIQHTDSDFGFKAKLLSPWLEFKGNDIQATLHVDLTGTFWSNDWDDDDDDDDDDDASNKEKKIYNFEDYGYSLSITAPIAVMDGDQTIHSGTNVISFDDGKKDTYHVILHMQNQGLEWKYIEPTDTKNKDGKLLAKQAVKNIEAYIRSPNNIRWLDITLGEVNNTKNQNSELAELFQPQSFKLVTRPGALDIFIQTKGGFNQGSASPVFDVKDSPFDTTDYTGAIILSHRLFQDKYLIPQIQKHCPNLAKDNAGKGRVSANTVDSGYQLDLVFEGSQTLVEGHSRWTGFGSVNTPDVMLDFSNYPVKLDIINRKDGLPQARWEWDHRFKVIWQTTHYNITMDYSASAGHIERYQGFISGKITDKKSDIATLSDNKLDFNFEFKEAFQPTMSIPKNLPKEFQNLQIKLDEFKFGLDEIQYFASTNVFAPGQHFIDLKTVRAPHDVFVMGKMKH